MLASYISHFSSRLASYSSSLTDDTKRFEILYNHAVNEVAITIKSQMMTPEAQSKLLSKFLEAQGRGVSWGRQCFTAKDDNASETIDAPLLSCACCGIRTNKSDRRKYHEVDVLEIEDKLKLREGDEDDTLVATHELGTSIT